jgi:hypothetical protein
MNSLFSVIQYEDINFNIIPMLIIDNIKKNLNNSELNDIYLQLELLKMSDKYFNFDKKLEKKFWNNLSILKKTYFKKDNKIYDIIEFHECFWNKNSESVWFSTKRHFNRIILLKKGLNDDRFQDFFKRITLIIDDRYNNDYNDIHNITITINKVSIEQKN